MRNAVSIRRFGATLRPRRKKEAAGKSNWKAKIDIEKQWEYSFNREKEGYRAFKCNSGIKFYAPPVWVNKINDHSLDEFWDRVKLDD